MNLHTVKSIRHRNSTVVVLRTYGSTGGSRLPVPVVILGSMELSYAGRKLENQLHLLTRSGHSLEGLGLIQLYYTNH
jgi:hypothetical protein